MTAPTPIPKPENGQTNWSTLVAEPQVQIVCALCKHPLDCRDHAWCFAFAEPIEGWH